MLGKHTLAGCTILSANYNLIMVHIPVIVCPEKIIQSLFT